MNVSIEMPRYKSHKEVLYALKIAEITRGEDGSAIIVPAEPGYAPFRVDPAYVEKHDPLPGGYFVVYEDGYRSWSPAEAFEEGYSSIEPFVLETDPVQVSPFDFGGALAALRAGCCVARAGWNGKDMFIYLVSGSSFAVNRPPLLGIFPEGKTVNYRPHIDMRTADGSCVPWVASQTDILANDWVIVAVQ